MIYGSRQYKTSSTITNSFLQKKNLTKGPFFQPKLTINQPGDIYEQEADAMADKVMRMPVNKNENTFIKPANISSLQRKCAHCEEEEKIQKKSEGGAIAGIEAPSIVHDVINSGGQPLDSRTRKFFEPRFGHNFSHVLVHSGPTAEQSARDLNAYAYTVGQNIVFGTGRFAPESHEGRKLIAHELTHVLQQRSVPTKVTQIQRKSPPASALPTLKESDKQWIKAFGLLPWLKGIIKDFRETKAQYSAATIATFKPSEALLMGILTESLNRITLGDEQISAVLNDDPVLLKDLHSSYREMIQEVVSKYAALTGKSSHEVYQAYHHKINELALPQSVTEPTASELSAALPEAERQKLTVITSSVVFGVDTLFSTKGATTTIPLPAAVNARFASGVQVKLQDGLKNVAGTIIPKTLQLDSTMTMALDLEPYGGDYAAYRFTYVEHRPKTGKPTQEVLIEKLGAIGLEGLATSQATAAQKKFDAHGFNRGSGWSDADFSSVLAAIAQISDSILLPVNGITFNRDIVDKKDPGVGGNYNPDTHTITIFDVAFSASTTRFGTPGTGIATDTVRAVAHEIGHAVDLLPLRKADIVEQKRKALTIAFAQFEDPPGSGNYKFPNTEQAKFNKLNADIAAAENALLAARSESGERYHKDQSGKLEMIEGVVAAGSIEFRKEAQKDGGKRITNYSNKEWQEYYAESFSLYITDPGNLQRLRPNVYAFFSIKHAK